MLDDDDDDGDDDDDYDSRGEANEANSRFLQSCKRAWKWQTFSTLENCITPFL